MRKTKIICTLGPSTDKDGVLRELVANGMNVARFNFSHGSYEEARCCPAGHQRPRDPPEGVQERR